MHLWKRKAPTEDAGPMKPVERWLQALGSHYGTTVCVNFMVCVSLLPALACVVLLYRTGLLLFLPAAVFAAGLCGPVWAAVNRTAWEIQFGLPCYLGRGFLQQIRENFKQGYWVAVLLASIWALLGATIWGAGLIGARLPLWVLFCLTAGGFLLLALSAYAFQQMVTRELSAWCLLKNAFLLIFILGWPSAAVGLLWAVLLAALLLFWPIAIPACLVLGLPVLLCISTQALTQPRIEEIFQAQEVEGAPIPKD